MMSETAPPSTSGKRATGGVALQALAPAKKLVSVVDTQPPVGVPEQPIMPIDETQQLRIGRKLSSKSES